MDNLVTEFEDEMVMIAANGGGADGDEKENASDSAGGADGDNEYGARSNASS